MGLVSTGITTAAPTEGQWGASNRDHHERFHASPVTASNLPGANTETRTPNQPKRDSLGGLTPITNYFALLGADDDQNGEGDQNDEAGLYDPDDEGDQNDEAGLYDPDDETTRIFLQQPSAGTTVRMMQPIFPPTPEFRPPTMVTDPTQLAS